MRTLLPYFKPYRSRLILLVALVCGQTTANLQLPDYLAHIVNYGIVGQDTGVVYSTGVKMLLVALAGGTCMVFVGLLASRIAAGLVCNVRNDVFSSVEDFSLV